eukprot:TRINITY_DN2550_c0_g1_i13.p1 TRINITY_DN2550_c0_g1~~TRINITY_DN2550_c0_g1_i13.p1  ORF type:complete len:198 (+),score=-21.53 TRINITY_DN2550_c0_g1_i13:231-824(+)
MYIKYVKVRNPQPPTSTKITHNYNLPYIVQTIPIQILPQPYISPPQNNHTLQVCHEPNDQRNQMQDSDITYINILIYTYRQNTCIKLTYQIPLMLFFYYSIIHFQTKIKSGSKTSIYVITSILNIRTYVDIQYVQYQTIFNTKILIYQLLLYYSSNMQQSEIYTFFATTYLIIQSSQMYEKAKKQIGIKIFQSPPFT